MPDTAHDWLYRKRVIILMDRLHEIFELSPEDDAAIVGNASYESNRFMSLHESGQAEQIGGEGICMWTGPRRRAYDVFCQRNALAPRTFTAGMDYLVRELQTNYAHVLDHIRESETLLDKVAAFERYYEGAGVVRMTQRQEHAEACLAIWNDQPKAEA